MYTQTLTAKRHETETNFNEITVKYLVQAEYTVGAVFAAGQRRVIIASSAAELPPPRRTNDIGILENSELGSNT